MNSSIVMATFNGEKYLEAQLESFVKQTKLPVELVVVDDASTDRTIEILKNFQKSAPFFVKLYVNEQNLGGKEYCGYGKVFAKAASLAKGDILFFSDQDDIWYPEKIAVHERAYFSPLVSFVVNDAMRVDKYSKSYEIIERNYSKSPPWLSEFRIGCCSSVRRSFFEYVMPIPDFVGHDIWLIACAVTFNVYFDTCLVLQDYRIHGGQVCGSPNHFKRNLDRIVGLFNNRSYNVARAKILSHKSLLHGLNAVTKKNQQFHFDLCLDHKRFKSLISMLENDLSRYLFVSEISQKSFASRFWMILKALKTPLIYDKNLRGKMQALRDFFSPIFSCLCK